MRTQVFFLAFALLAVLAQSSSRHHHHHHHHHHHSHVQTKGHGDGGGGELAEAGSPARAWPCCDNCGGCTKSTPPQCQCLDAAPRGCHPACRDCVKSSLSADPPVYQCMDRVPNFCQRRCAPSATAH
ncbi:Bowman-Birk type trypsin inhibitor-like [Phragmites australis]|uniref:Bowman-Birk type trypsin inhibitor-like n=1 Tax=Phragmites australis TaxID=29695 RepID=UPI002D78730B|nr:Bowman-Birk type trypsin inhibitor-like [Phragmites australis]